MAIVELEDYVYCELGLLMDSKNPLQRVDAVVVATKEYLFFIPQKSTGMFLLFDVIRNHRLFENCTIPEGVQKILNEANAIQEVEKTLIELLDNDSKYIHELTTKNSVIVKSMLGSTTVRMPMGKMKYSSITVKNKKGGKELKTFLG